MAATFPVMILLLVPVCIALVLAVYFIYRALYNKHVNKALNEGVKIKRWLPPFAVVLITVAILVVGGICGTVLVTRMYIADYKTAGSGGITYTINEDGVFEVTSVDPMIVENKTNDLIEVMVYKTDSQIFADMKILAPEKIEKFIVHTGAEDEEIFYKNPDDEYMEHMPLFFSDSARSSKIVIDAILEGDGSVGASLVINE